MLVSIPYALLKCFSWNKKHDEHGKFVPSTCIMLNANGRPPCILNGFHANETILSNIVNGENAFRVCDMCIEQGFSSMYFSVHGIDGTGQSNVSCMSCISRWTSQQLKLTQMNSIAVNRCYWCVSARYGNKNDWSSSVVYVFACIVLWRNTCSQLECT